MNLAREYKIRPACFEDARAMAKLIDIAGGGIPNLLWCHMAEPGQSALDVGQARVGHDVGGLSYQNALVADADGSVVGMLLGYIVERPDEEAVEDAAKSRSRGRPLAALQHRSVGTFYIDALAVLPGWRGCGVGSSLLVAAEQRAQTLGVTNMSIQHFAQNKNATKFYGRIGYHFSAHNSVLSHPCRSHDAGDVELLFKPL